MRSVAVAVGVLYLVCLVAAWLALAPAGHEGLLAPMPSAAVPDAVVAGPVAGGSPVDRAGLKPDDLILALNGASAANLDGIHHALHERRAGVLATLQVRRAEGSRDGVPVYGPPEVVAVTMVSQLSIASVVVDNLVASVVGLLILAVAIPVALARPGDLAARLLLLFGGCFAFVVVIQTAHWALPSLTLGNASDAAGFFMMVIGSTALLHLFLAFPVASPILVRLRRLGPPALRRLGGGLIAMYVVPLAVPVAVLTGLTHDFGLILVDFLAILVVALVAAIHGFWRSPTPLAHAQMKWVMWALAIFVAAFVLGGIVPGTTGGRVPVLPQAAFVAAFALLPIAIGFAILRYRLWDVDIIINRTLVYGVLTAALAVVYFAAIVLLQQLLHPLTGGSDLAIVGSTLAVAALFRPARRRIQAFFDLVYYRRRYDAVRALAAFSARLRQGIDVQGLSGEIQGVVQHTLHPVHVSLWLRTPSGPALSAGDRMPGGKRGGPRRPKARADEATPTRLTGRWLTAARAAWILIVVPAVALFVSAIPARVEELRLVAADAELALRELPAGPLRSIVTTLLAPDRYAAQVLALEAALAIGLTCTAVLVVRRRPDDWMAMFGSLAFVTFGVCTGAPLDALVAAQPVWAFPVRCAQSLGVAMAPLFMYLFPTGRFVPAWTRWMAVIWAVWAVVSPFVAASPFSLPNLRMHVVIGGPSSAAGSTAAGDPSSTLSVLAVLCFTVCLSTGALAQLYRYGRVSGPIQRRQTKWIAFSVAFAVVGYAAFALLRLALPPRPEPDASTTVFGLVSGPIFQVVLLLIPLLVLFSIARYRLWEIELLVNRALVYGAAAGMLGLAYLGSVALFQEGLRVYAGDVSGLAVAVWTLALAAVFHPLRQRLQAAFDRRFHRRKYDAAQTLAAYTATLREEVDLGRLNGELLAVVRQTMQPAHASVWLRPPAAPGRGGTGVAP
jgi:hypothetical protein